MPAPRRSTRRNEMAERKAQNQVDQKMLFVIFGVVGALGLLIAFALMKGGNDESGDSGASVSSTTGTSGGGNAAAKSSPSLPTEAGSNTADPLRSKVEQVLQAIQEGNHDTFLRCVSYPRFYATALAAGTETKRWSELDSLAQTLARKRISEQLAADEKTKEFMRQSNIRSYVVMEQTATKAKVLVIQQHMIETKREQERTLELEKVDGTWFLAAMTASAIQTPEDMQAVAKEERAAERAARSMRGLAPIEKQELLADTPADVAARIDAACKTLCDVGATKELRKAKRELADLGKPAIPVLLNLICGHEELATRDDQIIVHNLVDALKEVTMEDFGFAPGGIGGTMDGDIKKENIESLMRWFGWWKANKNSWNGPKPPAEDEKGS